MRDQSNLGFTLFEVIVVLIVIGIVSAVAISRMQQGNTELIGRTEVIKSHLRYAQSRAMNSDTIWGIQSDNSTYWLFKDGDATQKVVLPGEASDTIDLSASGLTLEDFTLSFDTWGIPHTDDTASDGNELDSTDPEAEITVSTGGDTRLATVTPNTGFIP